MGADLAGHQISPVIAANLTGREPVRLRVNQHGVILGGAEIQNRFQHLVFYFDELHGLPGGLFRFGGNDCHRISHKPHMAVKNQPVIGRWLGIGLACNGEPGLGDILPGVDIHNTGNLFSRIRPDFLNDCVGMGAAQKHHHQSVSGCDIIHIDRLAG